MWVANLIEWVLSGSDRTAWSTSRNRRCSLQLETLEAREVPTINPTGMEQELLELTNRMRMDPAGELSRLFSSTNPLTARDSEVQSAISYFGVSGATLVSQWASLTPTAPLAWADGLENSSKTHTQAMISADTQSHQLPGEADLTVRATQGGYSNWNALGENIYAYSTSVLYGHAGFAIDWGFGTGGLQNPAGHRQNIMNPSFREVGMSVIAENNAATDVGPLVITQDFGNRFSFGNSYLLGVVYADGNTNGVYNAGEGLGGVSVSITGAAGSFNTTTMTAGGYQLQVPSGSYTVTFSGGGLASPIVKTVTVGSSNVKVDGVAGQVGNPPPPPPGNSSPTLDSSYVATLTSISKNNFTSTGNTVASIVGNSITDSNANDSLGIAVYSASSSSGQWQYSLNAGTTWSTLSASTNTAARLLRLTDRIRFVPNSNFVGTVSLSYRAWDQTTGTAGGTASLATTGGTSAFSSTTDAASISVIFTNIAPVISTSATYLLPYTAMNATTPPSMVVGTLIGTKVTDADAGALKGIAITALDSSKGTWQYSINAGKNWYNLSTASNTSALLLRSTDYLRFYPRSNTTGASSMVFRAWDQTSGTAGTLANAVNVGGSTAFSADQVFAQVQVGNNAPVLSTANAFTLNKYTRGTLNTGTLVSTLLGYSVTDADLNAKQGIAITGLTGTATGTWQYSINGGTTWVNLTATASAARLLRSQDLIRYVPKTTFAGNVTLQFRAWDQFTGIAGSLVNLSTTASVGGKTAYSSLTGTATLQVA